MEECKICYDVYKIDKIKKISCGHELCKNCFLKLIICECPFCRKTIDYTKQETKRRRSMGIETNPDFSSNIVYNPNDFVYDHYSNLPLTTSVTLHNDIDIPNLTLHRTNRNRHRRIIQQINLESNVNSTSNTNHRRRDRTKRRRKLTDEEIHERRRIINLKKKMHYIRKEGRLRKQIAWYNNELD